MNQGDLVALNETVTFGLPGLNKEYEKPAGTILR